MPSAEDDEDDLGLVEPEIDAAIDEPPEEAEIDEQVVAMLSPLVDEDDAEAEASAEAASETVAEEDSLADIEPEPAPEADLEPEPIPEPEPEPEAEAEAEAAQHIEPPTEPAVPPAAAAAVQAGPETVEDLDAELSELADELLEGDFDDVEEVLREHESAGIPEAQTDDRLDADDADTEVVASPKSRGAARALEDDMSAEASEEGAEGDEAVPSFVGSVPEEVMHAASDDEPDEPEDADRVETDGSDSGEVSSEREARPAKQHKPKPAAVASGPVVSEPKPSLAHRIRLAGYSLAALASRPIEQKPAYIRDIVGWFAAVTLFNAIAVWIFWFTVSGAGPGDPSSAAVGLESSAPAVQDEGSGFDAAYDPIDEPAGEGGD